MKCKPKLRLLYFACILFERDEREEESPNDWIHSLDALHGPDGPGRLDQPDQPRLRDGQAKQPDLTQGREGREVGS